MIKSPLRYPGGKSRAIDLISTLLPNFEEYREPFLGGGSLFLYAKQTFPEKRFWVNDIYLELFKFWEMAQNDMENLIKKIYEWRIAFPVGKDLHKFLNQNLSKFNDIERGAAFFIYNRITFSGTTLSGGFSEKAFSGRFTESSIFRLKSISTLLKNTRITNIDYEDLVKEEGNGVFIFLDPPYFSATKSALYGKNGNLHKTFDHIRFAETMKHCKHNWLITYDDSEFVRELFSFANILPWDLIYGMRNVNKDSNQNGKEIFVSNYLYEYPEEKQLMLLAPKGKYSI